MCAHWDTWSTTTRSTVRKKCVHSSGPGLASRTARTRVVHAVCGARLEPCDPCMVARALFWSSFAAVGAAHDDLECTRLASALRGSCARAACSSADGRQCAFLRSLARDVVSYIADGTPIVPVTKPMILSAGFGDTGTRSLRDILSGLGYVVTQNNPAHLITALAQRDFHPLTAYDAWSDDPLGAVWPILAQVFVNVRLIVTTRPDYHRQYASNSTKCQERTKGVVEGNPFVISHVLSSCMMYGTVCPEDSRLTKALQDAHAEHVRHFGPRNRTLVIDIKAG